MIDPKYKLTLNVPKLLFELTFLQVKYTAKYKDLNNFLYLIFQR